MRLWYQTMTRRGSWAAYNDVLLELLGSFKDPGTEIAVHGIERLGGGIGDQYRYLEFIETVEVLENVERAGAERFDAFLIGNIGDHGLREAREIADIPVLGLCEVSMHVAMLMGANVGIVTSNEKHQLRVVENVHRYGLGTALAGTVCMKLDRLQSLNDGFESGPAGDSLVDGFLQASRSLVDKGAETIVPAVGVLMALLARRGIVEAAPGIPIVNGIASLLKFGEMSVRLRALAKGSWTSRRCAYAVPPAAQIGELRALYGPVYQRLVPHKPDPRD